MSFCGSSTASVVMRSSALPLTAARAAANRRHPAWPGALATVPTLSRRHARGAVALVDVAERRAAGPRARTVVADHLQLRVSPIGHAHGPHVGLGRQHVGEEAVAIPTGDGGIARLGGALVGLVAVGRHHADLIEGRLAEIADARAGPGHDRVALEGEIAGLVHHGAEAEGEVAP